MVRSMTRAVLGCTVLLVVLAGCLGTDPTAQKEGTGEERHDLAPLTERFDRIDDATAATWFSGTFGDDRVAGPSTYWIDAVVELPPDVTDGLVAQTGPLQEGKRPDVVPELREALPSDPLLTSDGLRDLVAGDSGWSVDVWLAPETDRLVLVARGQ